MDWLKYIFWGGIQYSPGSKLIKEYFLDIFDNPSIVSEGYDFNISKGMKLGFSSNLMLYSFLE